MSNRQIEENIRHMPTPEDARSRADAAVRRRRGLEGIPVGRVLLASVLAVAALLAIAFVLWYFLIDIRAV